MWSVGLCYSANLHQYSENFLFENGLTIGLMESNANDLGKMHGQLCPMPGSVSVDAVKKLEVTNIITRRSNQIVK